MKRFCAIGAALLLIALAPAACGSGKASSQAKQLGNSAQTKKAEAEARKIVEGCVNQGGGLAKMFHCAVPPHHGLAFLRCAMHGAPKDLHDTAAIEKDAITCGEKYR